MMWPQNLEGYWKRIFYHHHHLQRTILKGIGHCGGCGERSSIIVLIDFWGIDRFLLLYLHEWPMIACSSPIRCVCTLCRSNCKFFWRVDEFVLLETRIYKIQNNTLLQFFFLKFLMFNLRSHTYSLTLCFGPQEFRRFMVRSLEILASWGVL